MITDLNTGIRWSVYIKIDDPYNIMAKFDTDADQKQLRYMLEYRFFTQRGMAREIGIPHGAKISNFVCWLEKFKFIRKTLRQGKIVYEVPSRVELLNFYRRFRNMNDGNCLEF